MVAPIRESSSVYQQKFLQAIKFRLARTTKRLQPVGATCIFPPRATKYHKIREYSRCKWPTGLLFFTTSMANSSTELSGSYSGEVFSLLRVSRHIYTSGIPGELSVYAHMMSRGGSGPDSSQHLKLSCAKALLRLSFQCRRICEGFQLYGVFQSDNFEKSDR